MKNVANLRARLVKVALDWERHFGVAPSITNAISELDAALLVGMPEEVFCKSGRCRTAVTRGNDFEFNRKRYQVTANRPSGKKGSFVTLVTKKKYGPDGYGWDRLIWILYDRRYVLQEAWQFEAGKYRERFDKKKRLSPSDMRTGRCILKKEAKVDLAARAD